MTKNYININGEVRMDSVSIINESVIKVKPCTWEEEKATEAMPEGRKRLKGCMEIAEGLQLTFSPYKIGSQGSRYKTLMQTEHCEVRLTQGKTVIERWVFKPTMSAADICQARQREGAKIDAYYQSLGFKF
ncbi:MAG: hypothetical protein E7099_00480 [Mediterranea massiliensis]|nr:hypothetical protein [Mediterranea massiliensis]